MLRWFDAPWLEAPELRPSRRVQRLDPHAPRRCRGGRCQVPRCRFYRLVRSPVLRSPIVRWYALGEQPRRLGSGRADRTSENAQRGPIDGPPLTLSGGAGREEGRRAPPDWVLSLWAAEAASTCSTFSRYTYSRARPDERPSDPQPGTQAFSSSSPASDGPEPNPWPNPPRCACPRRPKGRSSSSSS